MCEYHGLRMFLMFICCYKLSNIPAVICAQIMQMPQDVTISAGMEATFQCIVKMNRHIKEELTYDVAWYSAKWNSTLTKNRYSIKGIIDVQSDGKYVHSTLKITRVEHADKGSFTCYIIQKSTIQATALLLVKHVPVPQCMALPRSVTITESITLSCIIGPGNYVTRLTWWYGTKNAEFIESELFLQQTVKSYLNTTVAVKDYDIGTIFMCVTQDPNDNTMTESCSTKPLNIVENEPRLLDVEVHALSTLPLTAGKQACFECKVPCNLGICHVLIQYTWAYHGSAKQLPRTLANRTCFKSVPLSDDGQPLRCSASVQSEEGVGELVLQVVDTMTTPQIEIHTNTTIDKLPNLRYNSCITPIIVTIVSMSFLIFLIIIGFIIFHKRQMSSKIMAKNLSEEYQVPDNARARKCKGRRNSADSSPNVVINSEYQQLNLNQIQGEETLMQEQHYMNVK